MWWEVSFFLFLVMGHETEIWTLAVLYRYARNGVVYEKRYGTCVGVCVRVCERMCEDV